MTQKLIKKLIAQNYKYIARSNDREFCATKAEMPFKDEDNFDFYELTKNETVKDLQMWNIYKLEDLVDKN